MKRTTLSVVVALALPLVAAAVPSASAAPAAPRADKPVPAAQQASHAAASAKMPSVNPLALTNYRQVTSAVLADPAGTQVAGVATCPTGSKVAGGGAVISSTSLAENLNGSFAIDSRTWRVYVNNSGSTDGTFRVYATCVSKTALYAQVVGTAVDNPAGTQVSATATCPTGTVPFGGGGVSGSLSTLANLNTSIPSANGWRVDSNNASSSDTSLVAYVVCGKKPLGYRQVAGTAVTVNPTSQQGATATCPGVTVALGGGGFSSSGSTSVNLNSSLPNSTQSWQTYENNGSTSSNTITPYVVCGRVS